MHKLEQHILEHWGHLSHSSIYVACSGGLDSVVLCSLLKEINVNLKVIHVNYQLRGQDSEDDASFVNQFCTENALPLKIKRVNLKEQLIDGGNLQELARNVRYDWFDDIWKSDPSSFIALAHHQDDQLETFFMNIARKSGVMGLACMPATRSNIIRPLLDYTKEDLKEYANSKGIKWREDVSNADSKYRRNLLRNKILPQLQHEIPSLNESVSVLVKTFQEKQKELENEIEPLINHIHKNQFLSIQSFESLNEHALIELFRQLGQRSTTALAVQLLNHKGTKVALDTTENCPFSAVVLDDKQFTF